MWVYTDWLLCSTGYPNGSPNLGLWHIYEGFWWYAPWTATVLRGCIWPVSDKIIDYCQLYMTLSARNSNPFVMSVICRISIISSHDIVLFCVFWQPWKCWLICPAETVPYSIRDVKRMDKLTHRGSEVHTNQWEQQKEPLNMKLARRTTVMTLKKNDTS